MSLAERANELLREAGDLKDEWAIQDLNLWPPVRKTGALGRPQLALSQGPPKAGVGLRNLAKQLLCLDHVGHCIPSADVLTCHPPFLYILVTL